jgi:putative hydrolase of the HAD superfamily
MYTRPNEQAPGSGKRTDESRFPPQPLIIDVSMIPPAIVFDLDDTIVDDSSGTEMCWQLTCEEAASRASDLNPGRLLSAIQRERDWFWADPDRHREGRLNLRAASTHIVERALCELGLDAGLAPAIANRYRDLREERVHLLPGAIETLEWFRAQGVRLGMATNGSAAGQRAKIDRFNLAPYFDRIIVEEEFGRGKPEREVYEALFDALGEDPAKTWFVGDNIHLDVAAPQALGAYAIWVDATGRGVPTGLDVRPDRIVSSIVELRGS